jgi:ring-1,2-phenylacetyl-CoA epoxidase subunit PaaD
MVDGIVTKEIVLEWLKEVPDPEIPVISIVELGVVRAIELNEDGLVIRLTPTYSGCPAMKQMEQEVMTKLKEKGIEHASIQLQYAPPWTTDWITEEAKEKLRQYGIAPPEHSTINKSILLGQQERLVLCPQCRSSNTVMISQFGSTACKALYKCKDCLEPFDYFKCI